jgi:predicted O-methyltransferase YrrM
LSILLRRSREVRDLSLGYAGASVERLLGKRPAYDTVGWEDALADMEARFEGAYEVLDEPALREAEDEIRRLLRCVHHENPRGAQWPADSVLARCCYLTCRLLRPGVVVETGVAYGVSATFILKALEENGSGALHSVDLPPLRRGYDKSWGVAVPEELRARWTLHRGSSGRVLPGLLEELGKVDVFLHDSLHTRRNMRREFAAVWPRLRTGGVLLADDVERNGAFGELRDENPALWRVVQDVEDKPLHGEAAPVVLGIAIK